MVSSYPQCYQDHTRLARPDPGSIGQQHERDMADYARDDRSAIPRSTFAPAT